MNPVHAVPELRHAAGGTPICHEDDLVADRGVCALVDGVAVAVFRTSFGAGLYAVDNLDPYAGASVLSRGLVGMTADGIAFVSSPLRKQRFDLATGRALDDPDVAVGTWTVRVEDGLVVVGPDVADPADPADPAGPTGSGHEG